MLNKNIMPDYSNSVMNIATSILKYYGAETKHKTIAEIDRVLAKGYTNVIFFIADGMGTDILNYHMPLSSFLCRHKVRDLTSVFPSTTPVATTSMYTGLSPLEHGWVGWNCYFKEIGQELVLFTNTDFYTHEKAPIPNFVNATIGYETINSKIERATNGNIKTFEVFPSFRPNGVSSIPELFFRVSQLCNEDGQKFILAYWDEPDSTMHKVGTTGKEIVQIISSIDSELQNLGKTVKDTVVIMAADHGQINMEENIFLNKIDDIANNLDQLPSLGKRVMSFVVKKGREDEFKKNFIERFHDDFLLFTREEFIKTFLGPGIPHPRLKDFIGDFVAVAIGNKMFQYEALENKVTIPVKANHAGLTHEEMIVPLLIFEFPK